MRLRLLVLLALALTAAAPSPGQTLQVGSATGRGGGTVSLPVSVSGASGMLACEFRIAYEATKLRFVSATAGPLASGFLIFSNGANGVLRVAMASGSAVSGSGVVANVTFQIEGAVAAGTTALLPSNVLINDHLVTAVPGTVTISAEGNSNCAPLVAASGTVSFSGERTLCNAKSGPIVCEPGEAITLTLLGQNGYDFDCGTTYSWSFGDGSPPVTTRTAVHAYERAAIYTPWVAVSNSGGSQTYSVRVNVGVPVATSIDFTVATTGLNATFTPSITPQNTGTTFRWEYGDGAAEAKSGAVPVTHTYEKAGLYTVSFIVDGSLTASKTINVGVTRGRLVRH